MITLAEARCRKFDWIYYTEPIKLQSGKFSDTYKSMYDKFLTEIDLYRGIAGRRVFHVSPLLFYSSEFWETYDTEEIDVGRTTSWIKIKREKKVFDGKGICPPFRSPRKIGDKIKEIKDFTIKDEFHVLEPERIDFKRGAFSVDPWCIEGLICFCPDTEPNMHLAQAIGTMLVLSKRCHMSLFYPSAIQQNRYKVKLGKVISCDYDDDFSMAFTPEAKLVFDSEIEQSLVTMISSTSLSIPLPSTTSLNTQPVPDNNTKTYTYDASQDEDPL